jgi:hypothetical protein
MTLFASGNNNHPIDMEAVARIVARGQARIRKSAGIPGGVWNRMSWQVRRDAVQKADSTIRFSSKPNFPPNSSNQSLDNHPWADTGNDNDFTANRPVPSQSFHDGRLYGLASPAIGPAHQSCCRVGFVGIDHESRRGVRRHQEGLNAPAEDAVTLILLLLLCIVPCLFLSLPLLRLETQRRLSRVHRPQPNELWSQDSGTLLFIEHTDALGIHILAVDRESHAVTRWTDTWPQWGERCRKRVVLFTGRSGSLNRWEAMVT